MIEHIVWILHSHVPLVHIQEVKASIMLMVLIKVLWTFGHVSKWIYLVKLGWYLKLDSHDIYGAC